MDEPDKNEDLWQLCEQCSELLYCGAKAYSERARAEDNQDSRMEM